MKTQEELIRELDDLLKYNVPSEVSRRIMLIVVELSNVKALHQFEMMKQAEEARG